LEAFNRSEIEETPKLTSTPYTVDRYSYSNICGGGCGRRSFGKINGKSLICHLPIDEGTQRFKRLFICPLTSSISFSHMRGIVAVDGTFLKGSFVHTLLLAIRVDAEGHIVILAWAIVEGENESSRKWFFSQLKDGLSDLDCEDTTIISDRDKGLQAA